jgi:hypothetical protein
VLINSLRLLGSDFLLVGHPLFLFGCMKLWDWHLFLTKLSCVNSGSIQKTIVVQF